MLLIQYPKPNKNNLYRATEAPIAECPVVMGFSYKSHI